MVVPASRISIGGRRLGVFNLGAGAQTRSTLFDAIPLRQSTRADYDGRAAPVDDLVQLESVARPPGVDMVLITERAMLGRVRDLIIDGNAAQMADRAFVAELKSWMRFSPRAALATGDGIYSAVGGNPALPEWLGQSMFDIAFRAKAEKTRSTPATSIRPQASPCSLRSRLTLRIG